VLENFAQIRPNLASQLPGESSRERFDRLEDWSRGACEALRGVFSKRLAAGFVRECHGDLHLRNIVVWQGQVMPFDCIEFNPALRWIDVMSEIAFLLMDLDDHGRGDLSARLLNRYLEFSGDYAGLELLRFYQVYRAMVRAKVESLRLTQLGGADEALKTGMDRYLSLAAAYTRERQPRLIIAHGLSGSGKTFVSTRLLEHHPLVRLRSDVERKRLYGIAPLEPSGSPRDGGIYSREANTRTYDRLGELASALLRQGFSVLVDAAFLKREEREQFRVIARRADTPFAIMHCEAEMPVQRQRVAGRTERGEDASEADLSILDRQLLHQEPLADDERSSIIDVDTTGTPDLSGLLQFLDPGTG
jgi:predicted kinase